MTAQDKQDIIADDPVVQEIREIRARMWEEAGRTMEGYTRLVKEEAAKARPSAGIRR